MSDASVWDEGGADRVALHVVGGALIGGLGGGGIGTALQGAAGAGVSAAFAGKLNGLADQIGDATGSLTLGNVVSNVLAGAGGALVGGSAGAFTASNADLYNRSTGNGDGKGGTGSQLLDGVVNWAQDTYGDIPGTLSRWGDQITGSMNADAQTKASQSPTDLIAQGTANGINGIIGSKGGEPPMASPGAVLVDSGAAQTIAGTGYVPGNATLNSGDDSGSQDASTPVGVSGSPMEVPRGTNAPATIGGVDYSDHAIDQMQGRGVPPSVVKNTIENGVNYSTRPGTTGYYDPVNNVRVVTNSKTGLVVTVIPGAP